MHNNPHGQVTKYHNTKFTSFEQSFHTNLEASFDLDCLQESLQSAKKKEKSNKHVKNKKINQEFFYLCSHGTKWSICICDVIQTIKSVFEKVRYTGFDMRRYVVEDVRGEICRPWIQWKKWKPCNLPQCI